MHVLHRLGLSGLLALSALHGGSPVHAGDSGEAAVFVLRVEDMEVGRETCEVLPDGWRSTGTLAMPGRPEAEYSAERRRVDGTITLTLRSRTEGKDATLVATLTPERIETTIDGAPGRTRDLRGLPAPQPYRNLVWGCWVDVGRSLAARAAAGTLRPGDTLDLVEVADAEPFGLEVRAFAPSRAAHAGASLDLLRFEITLAGRVQGTFLATSSGDPLALVVPAQRLRMVREGFEDAVPADLGPHTVLDSGPWRALLSRPVHAVTVQQGLRVPMRDGVRLAADLFRPAAEGRYPTVLVRTPYGRAGAGATYGERYAKRGYAVVVQDVRGRYESEGSFEPFRRETEDGSDTLDWVAARPWSNGDVGMAGGSYLGLVQWYAAKSRNPRLKAIVPRVTPPDPCENIPWLGGAFVLGAAWWARVVERPEAARAGTVDWAAKLATLPLSDLDAALGLTSPFLDQWLAHPPHDPWWEPTRYQRHHGTMEVAALNVSGWYDGNQPGAPTNFAGMRRAATSDRVRRAQHLVLGPWPHNLNRSPRVGEADYGEDAVVDLDAVELRWFDRWLKGVPNGVEDEDPVAVFVMGEDRWHREQDWPLPQTRWTRLHLAGKGGANVRDGGGTLALVPEAGSPPDTYAYDPARLPATTYDYEDPSRSSATRDLSGLPDRDDVLDFTSPPLAEAVEITGPLTAVLSVTTDAKDTDFVVALRRIEPGGRTTAIRSGVRRLRYRSGCDREDWAKPGEVSRLEIDLWATGQRLEAGDRLRVEVGSFAFPGCARNLNTGEPDATAVRMVVAHQTVFHDPERASYVLLPVIPRPGLGGIRFTGPVPPPAAR